MGDRSAGPGTRPSLLLRIRDAADADSWRAFADVYGPLVYRHCLSRGLQTADAQDVTQTVFARISRAIRTFDYRPEAGTFRGWLGTVVHHEVSRFLGGREAGRGRGGEDDAGALANVAARTEDPAWAEEFNAHLLRTALARARPHFEPQNWRAFELAWLEDRPAAEVARELGMAIDLVHVAKSRVLKRLRQEVAELADDTTLYLGSRP